MGTDPKPIKLSKRQKQLLAMLTQGLGNAQIAEQLDISEHTVKVHFWRLYQRIGVSSRGKALAWWNGQQPTVSIQDMLMLQAAFKSACKFIDGKTDRKEFDFYREQVLKMENT